MADQWARWLLERRFGGDEDRFNQMMAALIPVRDKVLENAALAGDETLLDVGCGDGLIAFGALQKLDAGRVIFSDISQDLLDRACSLADDMGVLDRCQFIKADTIDLSVLDSDSVDVVTTRSVLIYVKDKRAAFSEFYRVLKPEGVLSIFEPINSFAYPEPDHILWGYDVTPVQDLAHQVKAVYYALQPPESDPMLDFNERDLVILAERAGFREVHLELQVQIIPMDQYGERNWQDYLSFAPNPLVPTLGEALNQALTAIEIERLTAHMRPLVERGQGVGRNAVAYLWAVK